MFQNMGRGFMWLVQQGISHNWHLCHLPAFPLPLFCSVPLWRALCLLSWLWSPYQPSVQVCVLHSVPLRKGPASLPASLLGVWASTLCGKD